ncbi:hypothetical protein FNV43_RR04700 [Rhamnella rubrinervis]|uniref:DUF3741 domain-containing protein n=1 Tax=Rhamnella rubrinervis TaxID=2594499 RepID=A0A8K0MQI3_9ROSA|nr:hypothetical protein FNV43_RR04700 [Rhamnella rubrinervis]
MKLLSSSSSLSSPSSSAATFDANMRCCTSKSSTAGCLAGIFRRILCSGSLPTHPSDQITDETNSVEFFQDLKGKDKIQTPATPNLVARLMGLDSMPDMDYLGCSQLTLNSVTRSKSMNSVDRLAGFDPNQVQHRRVKSTLSFREVPAFVELENEEFYVLSFEKGKELRSRGRKCKLGFEEMKKTRTERSKKLENRREKVVVDEEDVEKRKVLSDLNGKEMMLRRRNRISDKPAMNKVCNNGRDRASRITCAIMKNSEAKRCRKSMKNREQVINSGKSSTRNLKQKKKTTRSHHVVECVEPECNSEDSSPVSVLDSGKFLVDPQVPISEEDFLPPFPNSRRKLSSEIEKCELPCPRKDHNLIHDEANEGKLCGTKKKVCERQEYSPMWDKICSLTEAELAGSYWLQSRGIEWNYEDFEGIGANFQSQILGQLLEEVVDQILWENP